MNPSRGGAVNFFAAGWLGGAAFSSAVDGRIMNVLVFASLSVGNLLIAFAIRRKEERAT